MEDVKAIHNLRLYMIGTNIRAVSSPSGKEGIIVNGRIQQGTINDGDEVQISDYTGTVYEVVSPMGKGFGDTGQEVTLAVEVDWKAVWGGNRPSIKVTPSMIIIKKANNHD